MKRQGFGQVEPNHLSAQRTAQIYAQLPAAADIEVLENGQFVKYDYANGEVNFTGKGEWMLVFNEVKLYDDFWRETYRHFAMQEKNYTPGSYFIPETNEDGEVEDKEMFVEHGGLGPLKGTMVPRVFKTNIGDIFTTNCLEKGNTDGNAIIEMADVEVGDILAPNEDGFLSADGDTDAMQWQVVKVYNMADMQPAVKVMRIA